MIRRAERILLTHMLIAAIIAAILGAGWWIWRVARDLDRNPILPEGLFNFDYWPPSPLDDIATAGTFPMSLRIRADVFRYGHRKRLQPDQQLSGMFEDGPWKAKPEQQRYAGTVSWGTPSGLGAAPSKVNIGHYFGLSAEAAQREIAQYVAEKERGDYALLRVSLDVDNILDLTDVNNIHTLAKAFGNEESVYVILADLIDGARGGNNVTTKFGYYAMHQGYRGILALSARAPNTDLAVLRSLEFWDEGLEDYSKRLQVSALRDRMDLCLVLFSGAVATQSIASWALDGGASMANPHHGMTLEQLAPHLQFGVNGQRNLLSMVPPDHWLRLMTCPVCRTGIVLGEPAMVPQDIPALCPNKGQHAR